MALRVWLPLTGTLENKGISNITVTNNGATVNANGKIGSCYAFNGSTGYISLTGSQLFQIFTGGTQQFSVAMWVYHADTTRAILFGDYSTSGSINFNIELNTSHGIRFYWAGSPDTSPSNANVGASTWTHVVLTYNGTKIQSYINGEAKGSWSGTLGTKNKTSGEFRLGRDNRSDSTAFNGKMNDFRVYDHCLSAAEVKEISQGLVLHYKLDDITNGIQDSSGYGHNGTILSGTATLTSNTARYSSSIIFNGFQNPTINTIDPSFVSVLTNCTVTWWEYVTVTGNNLPIRGQDGSHYIGAGSTTTKLYHNNAGLTGKLYKNGVIETSSHTSGQALYSDSIVYTQNQWTFFALSGANISSWTKFQLNNYSSSWPVNGYISDVRVYATALSADDILSLYHTAAKVDNLHNIHTFEYLENNDTAIKLTKSGQFKTTRIQEDFHTNVKNDNLLLTEPDGSTWIHVFHHNNPAGARFTDSASDWSNGKYIDTDRWYNLEYYLNNNPSYEFLVKQKTTSSATETKYRWIQTPNPLTATWTDVKPGTVTFITTSGYSSSSYGGMYLMKNSSLHMCIANGSNGNWFGGIGAAGAYNGGIPGYPNTTVTSGYIDLYIRVYINSKIVNNNYLSGNNLIEK